MIMLAHYQTCHSMTRQQAADFAVRVVKILQHHFPRDTPRQRAASEQIMRDCYENKLPDDFFTTKTQQQIVAHYLQRHLRAKYRPASLSDQDIRRAVSISASQI